MWYDEYSSLNLMDGNIRFILEDDEDMIKITYPDGMMIDVGKASMNGRYYITVVSSDDIDGWEHPLREVEIIDKSELYKNIQDVIFQHRNQ